MILATLANRDWYEYVAVAIQSVIDNNKNFKLYLFIEDNDFPYFKGDYRIVIKNFRDYEYLIDNRSPNVNVLYPKISLVPFLLPYAIDDDKVIFFDSDVVFDGSLDELWNTELGDNYVALVPEPEKSINSVYGNMGVSLLNLDLMRKDKTHFVLLHKLNTEFHIYICQDIINEVCEGRIVPLDNKWNATLWTGHPDKIIGCHGAGRVKPWHSDSRYYSTWLKYKDSLNGN